MKDKAPLAIWIFGPVGAGKSRVISRLPLNGFRIVDQDALLEEELRKAGLGSDTTRHTEMERGAFTALRNRVVTTLWSQVPAWRRAGEDLCFETTGNKPALFEGELTASRAQGYKTIGCALRCPLEACLARNRTRERVLGDDVVTASWDAFERFLADGTYARIFTGDRLEVCNSSEDAAAIVAKWIVPERGGR